MVMLCNSPVLRAVSLTLLIVPASAGAADAESLPGGSGEAFRERMLAWSAPAAEAAIDPAPARPEPEAPATLPRLSSRFGLRADPVNGGMRMHEGIDIPGPLGSPVLAAEGGTVTYAGSAGGYGLLVELDHGNGLRTRYAHLSRLLVQPGALVPRQQAIGLMGSTGHSTGSHLHFEVLRNGREIDPLIMLGRDRPAEYSHARPAPFSGETAPVHISRFARGRAGKGSAD